MPRIFITGSADGLGQLAARMLVAQQHEVVLHARNRRRGDDALKAVPGAAGVLIADLSDLDAVRRLAADADADAAFDAVIHNAGVYRATSDDILNVNVLAPYILTCLMHRPHRLIYLASNDHFHGVADVARMNPSRNRTTYADSKLWIVALAKAVARKWTTVHSNAVDPGWVPTKMGGAGAPDDLDAGAETQAWLAVSDEKTACVSGRYFYHKRAVEARRETDDVQVQDALLVTCAELTGVAMDA